MVNEEDSRRCEYGGKKTSDKEGPVKNYYFILFQFESGEGKGTTPLGQVLVDRKETRLPWRRIGIK